MSDKDAQQQQEYRQGRQRWEYMVEDAKDDRNTGVERMLDKRGNEGWELVSLQWWKDWKGAVAVFKRPK